MNQIQRITLVIGLVVIAVVVGSCLFIVTERDQIVITQWGRPVRVISGARDEEERQMLRTEIEEANRKSNLSVSVSFGAGLAFKIPFLQQATRFDNRLLEYESDPHPITTGDKRTLFVDNFARWRIMNPLRFMQNVRTEQEAQTRLEDIIYSVLRRELGRRDYQAVIRTSNRILEREMELPLSNTVTSISGGREEIMKQVTEQCQPLAREFGVLVIDVRLQRAELPEENMQEVYNRMKAERQRIAMKYEEEGKAKQTQIKAETDKEVRITQADAFRKARVIEGEGEAEALKIYAQGFVETDPETKEERQILGYQSDPEFYEFTRSLEALKKAADEQTTFVLTTRNHLFSRIESFE
ncbi:MAG TPA: protease modulator HflC [bacterium]|nr:protease modulator HflC [bacterium]HQP97907.1 protease modulator HflC [bacterium]